MRANHLTYSWYIVGVLMLAYLFSYVDRSILSLLVAPIRSDLDLSDTELSVLHGFAFAIFYTLLGFPVGRLADRSNRVVIIVLGIGVWSLFTAACGLARNFWQLFFMRVGVGVGEAALNPCAYSIIADSFPQRLLSRALSAYVMGTYLGFGVAFIVGGMVVGGVSDNPTTHLPLLGEVRTWQAAFIYVGLPGLLVMALVFLTVREPSRRGLMRGGGDSLPFKGAQVSVPNPVGVPVPSGPPSRGAPVGVPNPAEGVSNPRSVGVPNPDPEPVGVAIPVLLRFIKRNRRTLICHVLGFGCIGVLVNGLVLWTPSYFVRSHGWDIAEAGVLYGAVLAVLGPAGILVGGWVADRWDGAEARGGPFVAAAGFTALGIVPAFISTLVADAHVSLALIAVLVFCTSAPWGVAVSALQQFTPNEMRGQVSAIYLFFVNIIGIGLGPTLIALATDHAFGDDAMLRYAMSLVAGAAAILATVTLTLGLPAFRSSLKRAEAWGDA